MPLRLAADENFNYDIVRGVRRKNSTVDIVTVQNAGLSGEDDEVVLEWAATEGRVLLTHDVSTLTQQRRGRRLLDSRCRASSKPASPSRSAP